MWCTGDSCVTCTDAARVAAIAAHANVGTCPVVLPRSVHRMMNLQGKPRVDEGGDSGHTAATPIACFEQQGLQKDC